MLNSSYAKYRWTMENRAIDTGFLNRNQSYIGMKTVSHWCQDVLVRSLKSSILSSSSSQLDNTFWGLASASLEQSRREANMVAQGDGKFGPLGWPQNPYKPKKKMAWRHFESFLKVNSSKKDRVLATPIFPATSPKGLACHCPNWVDPGHKLRRLFCLYQFHPMQADCVSVTLRHGGIPQLSTTPQWVVSIW